MSILEILQLASIAIRLTAEVGLDIAEIKAARDENGTIPADKVADFVARAEQAVNRL